MAKEIDVQYLESVVKPLCKNPEEFSVERKVDDMGVLLTLTVSKDDCGVLIGKNGETAKSIRRLLHILGTNNNGERYNFRISSGVKFES